MKSNKRNQPRKKTVSLTNEQYEEIFSAAIYPNLNLPSRACRALRAPRAEPPKRQTVGLRISNNIIEIDSDFDLDGSLSTIYTEDFLKHAISSTPNESEGLLLPKKDRLKRLQRQRCKGIYVKCCECKKWRWLDNPDPDDLPQEWTCDLNSDASLASCSASQVGPIAEEDQVISFFMPGSIVWAKFKGFPWWPAMVDDCPDCEQYYWLDDDRQEVPSWYNVIFLDKTEVTRQWIPVDKLVSYKRNPNLLQKKKGKIDRKFKRRLATAIKKADEALKLSVKERLRRHSFLALWKKDFPEYKD